MQFSHLSVSPVMNPLAHYSALWLCGWRSSANCTKASPSTGHVYSKDVCELCFVYAGV